MRIPSFILLTAFACGGPSKVPHREAPPNPKVAAVEEAAQIFFESGQVIIDAGGDCEKMATSVGTWIDNTRARRHKLNQELQALDTEANAKQYREVLATRLDIVVGVQVGLDTCLGNENFRGVWERMGK